MAYTTALKYERSLGNDSAELVYLVEGGDDEALALAQLQTDAPATHNDLTLSGTRVEWLAVGKFEGRASYSINVIQPAGSVSFSFDTTGGTQHITMAKAHVGSHAVNGAGISGKHAGVIGITNDSVEGCDITVPVCKFNLTWTKAPGDMTSTYIDNLYRLTGKVNDATFSVTTTDGTTLTWAAGEVLFLGASISKRDSERWEVACQFAASPNVADACADWAADVKPSSPVPKKGWEYLWVQYKDTDDTTVKSVVKVPCAVFVERVYDDGDFSVL